MKEELIKFETAKLSKEKGFDVATWDYFQVTCAKEFSECCTPVRSDWNKYDDYKVFSRPTQSLLQKWLREVHNIDVHCIPWIYENKRVYDFFINYKGESRAYSSYEEALEIGLQEALNTLPDVKEV